MASPVDSAFTSGFRAPPGSWSWPDDIPGSSDQPADDASSPPPAADGQGESGTRPSRPRSRRHYRARTCRICLETVEPTFHTPEPETSRLGEMFPGYVPTTTEAPFVSYDSESGRLFRPCKCKGSSRYVHEDCLQQWRHIDSSYVRRNYWSCPTCGFQYRLERMRWGRWISSPFAQLALTLVVFLAVIFVLGFVADPIIAIYQDQFNPIIFSDGSTLDETALFDDDPSWMEHFTKGFASLGLLGFVKVMFSGLYIGRIFSFGGGGGRQNSGRSRVASLNWLIVIMGVLIMFYSLWKTVRSWSKRFLKKTGERVMDVQGEDDGDDDENDDNGDTTTNAAANE